MLVLIPSFQPDRRLVELVDDLRAHPDTSDILIVNDGSGPDYSALFAAAAAAGATVIGYPDNRGKGHALRAGFTWAIANRPGEPVVCSDSDGQHAAADIRAVARATALPGAGLVLGTRNFGSPRARPDAEGIPWRSRLGNRATARLFAWVTGLHLGDTQTGLRGCPAPMLGWLCTVPGERFDYEFRVLLEARRAGWPLVEVPIATVYSQHNESSHFRPIRDSARIYAPLVGHIARSGPGRLLVFGASGFGAFLVDLVLLLVLHAALGNLLVSVVGARAVSAAANYLVNDRIVFARGAGRRATRTSLPRYALLAGVLPGANYGLMWLGTVPLHLPLVPTKLVTELGLFAVSYVVQRTLVFRAARTRTTPSTPGRVKGVAARRTDVRVSG
ncbi:GtrA family protein [Propionibacterium sp.]|uniref:GtrA family protein n=1 Tax=Propionibacterium sp. TaxID=1977903 RepID=UPI00345E70A0